MILDMLVYQHGQHKRPGLFGNTRQIVGEFVDESATEVKCVFFTTYCCCNAFFFFFRSNVM